MAPTLIFALAALIGSGLTSPIFNDNPTCTLDIWKMPSVNTDCTFYATTETSTEYTDCGGCALATKYYGVGLPCQASTTIEGVTQITETACSPTPTTPIAVARAEPSVTDSPASTCTKFVLPHLQDDTHTVGICKEYAGTATVTDFMDCGGCALKTLALGPGPALPPCTTTLTEAWAMTTLTACEPSAAS